MVDMILALMIVYFILSGILVFVFTMTCFIEPDALPSKFNLAQKLFIYFISGPIGWIIGILFVIFQFLGTVTLDVRKTNENSCSNDG